MKWTRAPDDLRRFAHEQRLMLTNAARVVAPAGSLVYATCSSEPEENEEVVNGFLDDHPDFEIRPLRIRPALANADALIDTRGFLTTMPFRDGLDAYFAARLVRRGSA